MYTMIGSLGKEGKIFMDEAGHFRIERDYTYLVEATSEERERIFLIFPHLKPKE